VSVGPLEPFESDSIVTLLQPGERLTLGRHAPPKVDRPSLERITAWKRGQVAFQNTPLPDAVAEMNRYSGKKLVIGDSAAAGVRVSGIFRTGESETFALALLNTYPLKTVAEGKALVIYGAHAQIP
jgi:transmembrane sensor